MLAHYHITNYAFKIQVVQSICELPHLDEQESVCPAIPRGTGDSRHQ